MLKSYESYELTNRTSLPPSAKKVIEYIKVNGSGTSKEIMNGLDMSKRTLRYALRILIEENIVKRIPVLHDMRKVRYTL